MHSMRSALVVTAATAAAALVFFGGRRDGFAEYDDGNDGNDDGNDGDDNGDDGNSGNSGSNGGNNDGDDGNGDLDDDIVVDVDMTAVTNPYPTAATTTPATTNPATEKPAGTPMPATIPAPATTPAPPAGAIVAENLKDFGSVDDSLVFPRGAGPEIKNITQIAPRTFNFVLRHRGNPWSPLNPKGVKGAWYDGDRDLKWNEGKKDGKYHDKSRAEVTGLRTPKFEVGHTWDIATTVRLDPAFSPSRGYCNLVQPVFDQSFLTLKKIKGDAVTAELTVFTNGIGSPVKVARSFVITRGQWTPIVVRVKFAKDGFYQCSVNGDAFQGVNMNTTNGRQPFGPKFGLYMTATSDVNRQPLGDSIVQHTNIYCRRAA